MTKQYDMPPIVEVFWWDHYSMGDDWHTPGTKHEPCILSAIGYLVAEDDNYYWITSTYEVATGHYSAGTAVLKNCVTQYNTMQYGRQVTWNGQHVPRPKKAVARPATQ